MSKRSVRQDGANDNPQLVVHAGEPRVLDVAIGRQLGMARPTNIRQVIEANRAELETYGMLHATRATSPMPNGGEKEVWEYWPNEEQALCICAISKAPKAPDARRMLIKAFTAWRRQLTAPPANDLTPEVAGGVFKGVLTRHDREVLLPEIRAVAEEAFGRFVPALVEQRLLADPRRVALPYISSLEIAVQQGAPQRKRRGLVRSITARMTRFCLSRRYTPLPGGHAWLWPREAVVEWLDIEGRAMIQAHIDSLTGQQVFDFDKPSGKRLPTAANGNTRRKRGAA
ncbi:hypothetical protein ACIU1J_27530 [Azospirillum doebereinerae]|uniref:hypothetical protein n=1 Tax=Azospirillum doebereinerae TaxID=92933 RepID=UPI001EE5401A|nr:hypothetical protein [Azospirillum doebereinerae]MCG5241371.1 hypothetical protein [Azospirillum doebereinerae]